MNSYEGKIRAHTLYILEYLVSAIVVQEARRGPTFLYVLGSTLYYLGKVLEWLFESFGFQRG